MARELDFDEQLAADFLAEAKETAANIDLILSSSADTPEVKLAQVRREARTLRLRGGEAHPAIARVARLLDDELTSLDVLDATAEARLAAMVAKLDHVIDGKPEPSLEDLRPRLAKTFAPAVIVAAFKEEEIRATNKRVVLVERHQATARFIARELSNCGYRATLARDGLEAIRCVIEDRPDLVLTSVELGAMSGIDLLVALAAMPVTAGLPLAVITSYHLGDKALAGLPPRVAVIAKGANFARDFADALVRLDVT